MKIAFLFTKVRTGSNLSRNQYFGMHELRDMGHQADYLEIEQFYSRRACNFLRRYLLNMHFVHLLLFRQFFKYDVVVSSTGYASLTLKALLRIKSFKWVMLDFNILGTIGDQRTLKQKLFAWAVSRADGVVTISLAEKRGLEEKFPRLRGKVVFIYEATDLDMFRPTLSDPSPSDGYILSVGTYGRDFDSLVEAVKMLNMKTIIATKPECVAHLQPLPANVTAKLFDSKDMPALYAGARIVAVTLAPRGEYDSVGTLSLGEAYAMGKPTIVTKTESMESYVSDGVDAIFVPPRDPRTFLTTLEKVWNDEALRTKLGGNAARFAKNKLDSKHFASELAAFLQRVVG